MKHYSIVSDNIKDDSSPNQLNYVRYVVITSANTNDNGFPTTQYPIGTLVIVNDVHNVFMSLGNGYVIVSKDVLMLNT